MRLIILFYCNALLLMLTLYSVTWSTKMGMNNPIKILAYLGAISRWLTLNPEIANPLQATPIVNPEVARKLLLLVVALATTKKKSASIPKLPQVKSFLTLVVVIVPRFRRWSASRPPRGTIIVTSKCGNGPKKPVCNFLFHKYFWKIYKNSVGIKNNPKICIVKTRFS